jgi:endonuclease YncB( thermonuclease family)
VNEPRGAAFPRRYPMVVVDVHDGRLWLPGMAVDVSTAMIQTGWAVAWDGRGAQPKPPWPRVVS